MKSSDIRKLAKTDMISARAVLADLAMELLAAEAPDIRDKEDVVKSLEVAMGVANEERFAAAFFDNKRAFLGMVVYPTGSRTRTVLYVRSLVKDALDRNATGLLLVHNHPSGVLEPSAADNMLTMKVRGVLEAVEVELIDHVIIAGPGKHTSMKDRGYW